MALLTPAELQNVVPGSSMTKPKGVHPFERPPKTSDPEEGVQLMFDAITSPKAARKLVKTLKGGVPIDVIVDGLGTLALGEGLIGATALPIMAPALAAMVEGMAVIAGVEVKYSEVVDEWDEPDEEEVRRLVAKISGGSLGMESQAEEPAIEMEEPPVEAPTEPMGLMSPPTEEGIM